MKCIQIIQIIDKKYIVTSNYELISYFVKHIVFVMAEFLSIPVAQREAFAQFYEKKAQASLASALFTDAQSHPNDAIVSAPFIDVRLGAQFRVPNIR